ncbi:Peroxiredoxin-like 2C [Psilocybe cubensis]|uniref:Peroxiredoxin-like 2C n=1 Tax=Psilocybe cubensis TaxID=181762 RepID=A0ACB8HEE4_PSICU|nr:Peroxiredoxin-like 2C [Psilocybe cubensis]KAH9486022.1 Peroxiredoxin-like 2C [Psilocybe cubensis]
MKNLKELPDQKTLEEAGNCDILDIDGNKVKFSTIFAEQKTIVVFIRHFFCGVSNKPLYVEALASVPEEALTQASTRIVVIGCGGYGPIKSYKEATKFNGLFFADPSLKLYHALGMDIESLEKTPVGEVKRSYLTLSAFSNLMMSLWRGPFKHPWQVGKQGKFTQLGGEFILGPGSTCLFASRMKHTEDHVEVKDLMKEAGVVY